MRRVIVVGAGVVGLSCAVRLLEAGHRVDVLARELPQETTSAVAAAIWSPYSLPQEHMVRWARASSDAYVAIADDPASGVVVREGTEVFATPQPPQLWWHDALPPGAGPDLATSLPDGCDSGLTMRVPIVEMPIYLRWLVRQVVELGGTITRMNITELPCVDDVIVVNASGIGARHLAHDHSVAPVQGQVVLVEQFGLERWVADADAPTYVIPRSEDVVVGGTALLGEWSHDPDPGTARDILARATRLVPELAGARVLKHRAGLRPHRRAVRLEREGRVIHCYGHGGCGVTVAWGCADDVVGGVDE